MPPLQSFAELISELLSRRQGKDIDLVKFDCEGCEHSCLGCTPSHLLRHIRYIVGEYHDIQRFYRVMTHRLFATHSVALVGGRSLGSFFAERIEPGPSILKMDRAGMLLERPWLTDFPIEWNTFNQEWVPPGTEGWHGIAASSSRQTN